MLREGEPHYFRVRAVVLVKSFNSGVECLLKELAGAVKFFLVHFVQRVGYSRNFVDLASGRNSWG